MKLTPCPFCNKAIPARMNTCPYCHRDERGAPIVMDSKIPAAAATEMTPQQIEGELTDLASDDGYAREQAITRLSQYGLRATLALHALLADHGKPGRAGIAKALGHIADIRSIGPLSQAVKQGEENVRISALWALAQYRDSDVLPILLSEAENSHPVTQNYLAYVIGNFRDPRVLPVLTRLALHGTPEVMYQAAFALGEWNEPLAINTLQKAARRKDPLQRAVALASLKMLGAGVPMKWHHVGAWGVVAIGLAALCGGLLWLHK